MLSGQRAVISGGMGDLWKQSRVNKIPCHLGVSQQDSAQPSEPSKGRISHPSVMGRFKPSPILAGGSVIVNHFAQDFPRAGVLCSILGES